MVVINLMDLPPFFLAIPPLLPRLLQVLFMVIIILPFQLEPYLISFFPPLAIIIIIILLLFIQANEFIIIISIIIFFTQFMVIIIKHG
jgi:hypothetical protein